MLPFVSFQTLAYNAEDYIAKTIESVLSQSESNFQYQIRDNGSTDRTGEIIKAYAKKDSRIIVYKNKVNGKNDDGTDFSAKKPQFPKPVSEYVSLLDSDDCLDKDFVKILYGVAQKDDADIIICGTRMFKDGSKQILGERIPPAITFSKNHKINASQFIAIYGSLRPIWGRLIRTDFYYKAGEYYALKVIPKPVNGADTSFMITMCEMANKVVFVDRALHNYRIREVSLYHSKNLDLERIRDGEILFNTALDFLNKLDLVNHDTIEFLCNVHYNHVIDLINLCSRSTSMSLCEKLNFFESIMKDECLNRYLNDNNFEDVFNNLINRISLENNKNLKIYVDSFLARLLFVYKKFDNSSIGLVFLLSAIFDLKNDYLWGKHLLNKDHIEFPGWFRQFSQLNSQEQKRLFNNRVICRNVINSGFDEAKVAEIKVKILDSIDKSDYKAASKELDGILALRPLDREATYFKLYLSYLVKDLNNLILTITLGELFWSDDEEIMKLINDIKDRMEKFN